MPFKKIFLQPVLIAMVTKFKQHAQYLHIVVSTATDVMQNYKHWTYFIWQLRFGNGSISMYLLESLPIATGNMWSKRRSI